MKSAVDWSTKGLWLPDDALAADTEFATAGHHLFDGPFTWPVMVAKRSALEANIATMAAYCAKHGVDHAPHGKTTMAPTLFAAQLDAGAWGITVATASQALAARRFGVPRVLLANELLDPQALRWAAAEVARGWEFLFYVDSLEGVSAAGEAVGDGGPMRVLVEMGYPDGRTGCRTPAQASAVARAVAAADRTRARRSRRLRRSASGPRQRDPVSGRHRRRGRRRGRSLPVPLDRVGRRQCLLRHRGRPTDPAGRNAGLARAAAKRLLRRPRPWALRAHHTVPPPAGRGRAHCGPRGLGSGSVHTGARSGHPGRGQA